MSEKQYFYDDKGNYVGYSDSSYHGGGDLDAPPLWIFWVFIGLISIFVGIFGGIGAMLKFAFWASLIFGGFCLAGAALVMLIFALDRFFNKITNDHATIIWIIIVVVVIFLIINGIHNWLFN